MSEGQSKPIELRCQNCDETPAELRRQNTSYEDDSLNWGTYCQRCQAEVDEHWDEMWTDYNSGRL